MRRTLSRLLRSDARRTSPRHAAPRHGALRQPAGPGPAEEEPVRRRSSPTTLTPAAIAERIERAPSLDRPVRALSDTAVRALPPGPRTDALHGVPFGQPAHPALVRLPLGCWSSAVLLDLFPATERASATLIATGLLSSLPSAAAGLADWSALHRHQQRVGLVHAASQMGAASLFGLSLLARAAGRHGDGKVLSAGGIVVATAGAYLGGHLALRLGAGASHAEPVAHLAGLGWHDLCPLSDLPDGRPVRRQLGYLSLLALRQGDAVWVLSDHCAHLGGPLHQGRIVTERGEPAALGETRVPGPSPSGTHRGVRGSGGVPREALRLDPEGAVPPGDNCVTCPWHGSTFRLEDGSVVHGPATARQPAFESRVNDSGTVQVRPRLGDRPRHVAAGRFGRITPRLGLGRLSSG